MSTFPAPIEVIARNRALRTFVQGLALDAGAAAAAVLAAGLADVHWTRAWWIALGLLTLKTVVHAAAAYVAARVAPPKV